MKKLFLLLCLAIFLMAATANADPVPVYEGVYADAYLKQNTFPLNLMEEQVFLDLALSTTITGHVGGQTDPRLVKFSSSTDVLDAANGFSNIKAQDGFINNVTITAPGYFFTDLIFSVNFGPKANNDLTITANSSGGTDIFAGWVELLGEGGNRILLLSTTGNSMLSVTLDSVNGVESIGGFDELKQTEISGFTSVPEPGILILLGIAMSAIGAASWRISKI
jgi:hypothetical protein